MKWSAVLFPILMILMLGMGSVIQAQSGDFSVGWWTVDGGGGVVSEGDYLVSATSGQADAGKVSGGDYTINGGFWDESPRHAYDVYLPMLVRP